MNSAIKSSERGTKVNFHVKDKNCSDLDWEERSKDTSKCGSDNQKQQLTLVETFEVTYPGYD